MNHWAKNGVLERVFSELQARQAIQIKIDGLLLDSTAVKVHPDGTGALKKRSSIHRKVTTRAGWTTKIHLVAATDRHAVVFSLSPGNAPEGRKLIRTLSGKPITSEHLLIDRAYEGDETRQLALDLGFYPVVPPKKNRINA